MLRVFVQRVGDYDESYTGLIHNYNVRLFTFALGIEHLTKKQNVQDPQKLDRGEYCVFLLEFLVARGYLKK